MNQFDRVSLESDWLKEYKKLGSEYANIASYIIIFSYPTSIFANYNLVDEKKTFIYLLVYFAPSLLISITLILKKYFRFRHEILVSVLVFSVFSSATYRVDEQSLFIYLITNAVCFIASSVQMLVFPYFALIYFAYILLVNILISYFFYDWGMVDYFSKAGGVVISVLGIVFTVVVQFRYRILKNNFINSLALKQSYQLLEEKTNIIEEKSKIIEEKNQDITSSISYAQRIQTAMLPLSEKIVHSLPEHFIFFKPRDIVSGDFYWFEEIEAKANFKEVMNEKGIESVFQGFTNPKVAIAAIDCTGHGVPGAFMSMIADSLLNTIVDDKEIFEPNQILDLMHEGIYQALKQKDTGNTDGMDMAICVIDKITNTLEFSGAINPLIYIQNNVLYEIKGDNFPVGGFPRDQRESFSKHTVDITLPTTCYLYSDGYQSQFGGQNGKKFMASKFKKLLLDIHQLPMEEQKNMLEHTITTWMDESNQKQLDDMMVIGFKINP